MNGLLLDSFGATCAAPNPMKGVIRQDQDAAAIAIARLYRH
jgi:hypothetical protein